MILGGIGGQINYDVQLTQVTSAPQEDLCSHTKKGHLLANECLGEMDELKLQKTHWKPSGYISRPSLIRTEMLTGNL